MKRFLLYIAGFLPASTLLLFHTVSASIRGSAADNELEYGVDVTWPHHYYGFNSSSTKPFGNDPEERYEDFMEGCRRFFPKTPLLCDKNDQDRIDMNQWQPQESINYTDTGFKKIKCPPDVWELIEKFWKANFDPSLEETDGNHHFLHNRNGKIETWPKGNVYMNPWDSPANMLDVREDEYQYGGPNLTGAIYDAARVTLEEWTQQRLHPTSLYGVRIYTDGAILTPHVDRNPLVTSAIVNVDQDLNEPWPLEVIDRDGIARNVTMEPGDMVLYESQSTIHGRPFPMNGKYYANIFIHFAPIGPLHSEEIEDTYEVLEGEWNEADQDYEEDTDEREEDEILDTVMRMAEEIEEDDEQGEENEEEEEELIDAVVDTIARDLNEHDGEEGDGEYYEDGEEGEYDEEEEDGYYDEDGEFHYYDEEEEFGDEEGEYDENGEPLDPEAEWVDEEEEEEDL